ncbi:MAG: hypothetical protein K5697_08755, partial [Lachnospiraceae bacterium]|nr:hypothetical protein [Lachnospiraceae bacterium]
MKRKKHVFKKAIAMGLLVFLLPGRYVSAGDHDGVLVDHVDHSDKDFSEYQYEHMDGKDFDAIIAPLDGIVDDTSNADQVLEIIIAMEDYCNKLNASSTIAHIHGDLVADDAYWDDELKYSSELYTDVADKVMQCYRTIATSANSDVLHDRIDDDDDWQDILDYQDMTQEQKDLRAKETDLELQYDIIYNKEFKASVGGKDYTEDELSDAYGQGTITRDEYMQGLSVILQDRNIELGNLYLDMVDVRSKLALSYGYSNYADWMYEEGYERDYKFKDMADYRQGVKDHLVPLQDTLIMQMFGYNYSDVQAMSSVPMTPSEGKRLLRKHLPEISNDMLVSLDYMEAHSLIDMEQSKDKAPGAYTTSISGEYNAPFLYICADGTIMDLHTLVHEFGHYNQMYYMSEDAWYYGSGNLDLAEIHSQGLEMLFMDYSQDLYGQYADTMNLYSLYNMCYSAIEGVKEDDFQYRVYSNASGLTLDDLNQMYYDCCVEYGGQYATLLSNSMTLSGEGYLPQGVCLDWVQIPHTFQSPLYYISYSTSVAAVFELFDCILNDRDEGIDIYLKLVSEGTEGEFQETLVNAGMNNPIANPRFEVYASDILYYAGLADTRIVDDSWRNDGSDPQGSVDPDTDPDKEVKPEPPEDPDYSWTDDDIELASDVDMPGWTKICLIIVGVLVALGLVLLIIMIVKRSSAKKKGSAPHTVTRKGKGSGGISLSNAIRPGPPRPGVPLNMQPGMYRQGMPMPPQYMQGAYAANATPNPFMPGGTGMQANPYMHNAAVLQQQSVYMQNMQNMQMNAGQTMPNMQMNTGQATPNMQMNAGQTMPNMQMNADQTMQNMQMNAGQAVPNMQMNTGRATPNMQMNTGRATPNMQMNTGQA